MEYTIQCLFKIGGRIFHLMQNTMPSTGALHGPKVKEDGFYSSTLYYNKIAALCN